MQSLFLGLVVMHAFKALGLVWSPVCSVTVFKIMQTFIVQWPKTAVSIHYNALMKTNAINQISCFLL